MADNGHKVIEFTDPSTGARKSLNVVIPKGKESDIEYLTNIVDDHLKNPTRFSEKKGSIKAGKPAHIPGEALAPYLPGAGMMDRMSNAGDNSVIGGLEDTVLNVAELMGIPGGIKAGLKPVAKALIGSGIGSSVAEHATGVVTDNPDITKGAGILGGLAGGGFAASDPQMSPRSINVLKGAGRGAWQGATEPATMRIGRMPVETPVPASLAGAASGALSGKYLAGTPGAVIGGLMGGIGPIVKGAYTGAVEGYKSPIPVSRSILDAEFTGPKGSPSPYPGESEYPGYVKMPDGTYRVPQQFIEGSPSQIWQNQAPPVIRTGGAIPMPGPGGMSSYPEGTAPENASPVPPAQGISAPPKPQLALPAPYSRPMPGPETGFEHFTPPNSPTVVDTTPSALPPGVGDRSGQAIPLAPSERVPGTGKFSPAGTKAVRKAYYAQEPTAEPAQETAKPPVETPAPVVSKESVKNKTKTVKTPKEIMNDVNKELESRKKTSETKPASNESTGDESKKEAKGENTVPKNENVGHPAWNKILSEHEPSWSPENTVTKQHMYKVANSLGEEMTPIARELITHGYDVEPSRFGDGKYGLGRSGKRGSQPSSNITDRVLEFLSKSKKE